MATDLLRPSLKKALASLFLGASLAWNLYRGKTKDWLAGKGDALQ
jgi:hypothetical protein